MTMRPPLRDRLRLTLVPEPLAQVLLDPLEVRVQAAGRGGRGRPRSCGSRSRRTSSSVWRTDRPWREDGAQDVGLAVEGEPAERPPVALGEAPVADGRLDVGVEVEQAKRVGDGRARLADAVGDAAPGSARTRR